MAGGFFDNTALLAGMRGRENFDRVIANARQAQRDRLEATRGPVVNHEEERLRRELAKANATIDDLERKYRAQIAITAGWKAAYQFLKGLMLASGVKALADIFIENIRSGNEMINEPTRICWETRDHREIELIADYEKAISSSN